MSQTAYQLSQAWAGLRAKRGFFAAVVVTLGITLGALLCILTLAYVVIAKPLPYPEQEQLYQLHSNLYSNDGELFGATYTYPSLVHLYDNEELFSESAIVHYGEGVLSSEATQPTLRTTFVSPGWFELFGATMTLGRSFEQTEAKDSFNPVAILSYATWQDVFGGAGDILDRSVTFNGTSFRIVGVVANAFIEPQLAGVGVKTHVYLPWDYNPTPAEDRDVWGMVDDARRFVGKLDSSLSQRQVEQTLTTLLNGTWQDNVASISFFEGWAFEMERQSLKDAVLGDSANTVLLLLVGVIGLVLIAIANITNLFMSRTAEQQRELAIQAAVGASKGQLFKSLLAQSGLVVFVSMLVALGVASIGFWILQQQLAERLPRVDELGINAVTLGAAVVIVLVLALFFAKLSANMINYRALNTTLQSSGKGTGIQVSHNVRLALIVSQVAIVTLLVFVNLGLLKDSVSVIKQPLGFSTGDMVSLTVDTSGLSDEEAEPLMVEVRNKFAELPVVEDVSRSTTPFNFFGFIAQTIEETQERLVVETRLIDDRYFQMIDQPLIEGDYFSAADIRDGNRLMIVNDVFAKKLAPEGSALGTRITYGDDVYTVSGVVTGVQMPAADEIPMRSYPLSGESTTDFMLKLRPQQNVSRELAVTTLQQVSGQLKLRALDSLDAQRSQLLFTQYTTAITSAVLAALTFLLAAIGLYGVLNYATQMRRFELGTRLAIGATRTDVLRLIIKDNAGAVAIGVVVGLLGLAALYFGFSEVLGDYINLRRMSLILITLGLVSSMALFACYWPLRPIINAPPIRSLRGAQ